jgi:hypothetical protein
MSPQAVVVVRGVRERVCAGGHPYVVIGGDVIESVVVLLVSAGTAADERSPETSAGIC